MAAAHNPKVVGSNPAPATTFQSKKDLYYWYRSFLRFGATENSRKKQGVRLLISRRTDFIPIGKSGSRRRIFDCERFN